MGTRTKPVSALYIHTTYYSPSAANILFKGENLLNIQRFCPVNKKSFKSAKNPFRFSNSVRTLHCPLSSSYLRCIILYLL